MEFTKKITSKLFLLALIAVLGCSKDIPQPSLLGTWKETKESGGGCNSSVDNYKSNCTTNCNIVITATTIAFGNISGSYTTTGSTIAFTSNATGPIAFTYQLTAATLILAYKDSSDGCTYILYYSKV